MGEQVVERKSIRVALPHLDILVVGSSSSEALLATLAKTSRTSTVTVLSTPDLKAHRLCTPALTVFVRPDELIVGALALPGRAGCGHCASERMRAAAIANPPAAKSASTAMLAQRALMREVRAIVRHGTERSPLLDHVMIIDAD